MEADEKLYALTDISMDINKSDRQQFNYLYLHRALAPLYQRVQQLISPGSTIQTLELNSFSSEQTTDEKETKENLPVALFEVLCQRFNLSEIERNLLLLCLGVQVDAKFALLCSKAPQNFRQQCATFNLAVALFGKDCYFVLMPDSTLYHWQLIEIGSEPALLSRSLRVADRVFHYAVGNSNLDVNLTCILKLINEGYGIHSHQAVALQLGNYQQEFSSKHSPALLNLYGNDLASQQNIALLFSCQFDYWLYQLDAYHLPNEAEELTKLQRLLLREALLHDIIYLLVCDTPTLTDSYRHHHRIGDLAIQLGRHCILASPEPFYYRNYPIITIEAKRPTQLEQMDLWKELLPKKSYPLEQLVAQYDFTLPQIQSVCVALAAQAGEEKEQNGDEKTSSLLLKQLCQSQSRKQLEGLVQLIDCKAGWDDLVLPAQQYQALQTIVLQVAHRHKVYHQWGFADKSARGLGINALFAGPSGTGKTLAAEVIANQLQVDLYHIDLSAVVSKYIGETEKNLKKVFDLAEGSGAVLLFDEADALFGKRSEVKDSHDRHANIEISYLLQRMEAYRGLSILTTNLKTALDNAFMRRIRFVINFPFPEQVQRMQIWQRVFPKQTPLHQLDINKLARLTLAGGDIRNIGLGAAFLAAEANEPVMMQHLLQAAQNEYLKLGKSLNMNEIRDWV